MPHYIIGYFLRATVILLLFSIHCTVSRAYDGGLGGVDGRFSVTTNHGRVIERYGTINDLAIVEYPANTNDMIMVEAFSTNSGRIFKCTLALSQLKTAPKWDAEKTPPPLSPRRAEEVAVRQAYKNLGPSKYNAWSDFVPSHHWVVTDIALLQTGWNQEIAWYYSIGVKRVLAGSSHGSADARIFVTMDGKAAPYVETNLKRTKEK